MNSKLFEFAKRYERNPVVRALVQLIPYGAVFDVALTTIISNIREDRARTFFDELAKRDFPLTEEEIQSEDFLHAFFATSKAALNTRRREKIRLFARLLHNYGSNPTESDEFEEHLSILDDLSYREFQVLLLLKQFEDANPQRQDENEIARTNRFWQNFQSEVAKKLEIPTQEINGVLARLNRTGLYETFTGAVWGYKGHRGGLTSNFYRFIQKLKTAESDST